MKQGERYDKRENEIANARLDGMSEGIDDFYYFYLRKPSVVAALANANDKTSVIDIIKNEYDKMKVELNKGEEG